MKRFALSWFCLSLVAAGCDGCDDPNPNDYCDSTGCYVCDGYGCRKTSDVDGGKVTIDASPDADTGACSASSDCKTSESCVNGACVACGGTNGACTCSVNADCGKGFSCAGDRCIAEADACQFSSECDQGKELCASGQCLTTCKAAADCGTGATCEKGVCRETITACTSDAQCSGTTPKCILGECRAACTTSDSCGAGNICNQGECVLDTRPNRQCSEGNADACPSGQTCKRGFCMFTCDTDSQCKLIDARIPSCTAEKVCRSAAEANPGCLLSSQCGNDKDCIDNSCL